MRADCTCSKLGGGGGGGGGGLSCNRVLTHDHLQHVPGP